MPKRHKLVDLSDFEEYFAKVKELGISKLKTNLGIMKELGYTPALLYLWRSDPSQKIAKPCLWAIKGLYHTYSQNPAALVDPKLNVEELQTLASFSINQGDIERARHYLDLIQIRTNKSQQDD